MILSRPRLRGATLYFSSEEDLWAVPYAGGEARRLTRGTNRILGAEISRDGERIALVASEEGSRDVYLMAASGGPLERRTWLGAVDDVLEFADDDSEVRFCAARGGPMDKEHQLWTVPVDTGLHRHEALGPVRGFATDGPRRALCRFASDLSRWKRYRGGRAGRLWVDVGDGWVELPELGGNVACPFWIEGRLGFVSDHGGSANLYTCAPDGSDLVQLTSHADFSVRSPSADGGRVVYECGGDLWTVVPGSEPAKLSIQTHSQRTSTQLQYPHAGSYLGRVSVHPRGHSLAITTRGRPFIGGHWEGPMEQLGHRQGVRYRHVTWLDDTRLVWTSDHSGEEQLEIHDLAEHATQPVPVELPGRIIHLAVGTDDRIAVVTHDSRLLIVDLKEAQFTPVVHNVDEMPPSGVTWSPDGRWLAWSEPKGRGLARIRLADTEANTDTGFPITDVTDGHYPDRHPDFDPLGRFLYFVSFREFSPIPDQNFFGYAFPKGSRPYLVTLKADTPDPFQPPPRDFDKPKPLKAPAEFAIDLVGIQDRVVRFPVSEANYSQLCGLPSGRVLLLREGVNENLPSWKPGSKPVGRKSLLVWDFDSQDAQPVHNQVTSFVVGAGRKTLALRSGNRLRVFPADADKGVRAELKKEQPFQANRKTYWVDLNRVRLAVEPLPEWRQMALETWRLMRDHFWESGMAGVDWDAVRDRYLPLVDRVSTRSELSEVLWSMVGEVATSHAYELGGAYPVEVSRAVARLAADFSWTGDAWRVDRVHRGDIGNPRRSSPLLAPGLGLVPGSLIHSIAGEPVREDRPLEAALIGHAGRPVSLEFTRPDGERQVGLVKPLLSDQGARYRTWVAQNRARVHEATQGRVGYVHVPNMGADGFADFHRDFLEASTRDGLIVDVRFNGGGHVSQLLLTRLMQKRLAYTQARHFGLSPYPSHSVLGPMVALTNENAGSDGDIFSYNWKQLGLGKLIGTRTWGGVVGINPRTRLVDGTVVTQPEFAFWFHGGAGWNVEGRGVDPDIEVRHTPEDYLADRDAQLERGILEIQQSLTDENPGLPPLEPPPAR